MKVLTIRNPWAYAIFHLGKDVENRSWYPREYRGPLLIHAGANRAADPHEMLCENLRRPPSNEELKKNFVYAAVIGIVELKDCIRDSKSDWADKDAWHWILRRPHLFKHPYRAPALWVCGNLGRQS